ncbi:MAG TPA: hypothetical protein VF528_04880 [Pyrinomonadaceae bacterium]|jgi:hypothetical protein
MAEEQTSGSSPKIVETQTAPTQTAPAVQTLGSTKDALEQPADRILPSFLSPEDRTNLEKEYDRHIHFYEFYLEYGLKSVAVYYAVVGGILSIYYAAGGQINKAVIGVLLFLSLLMSLALGVTFIWGRMKWQKMEKHINELAEQLKIIKHPDVNLLKPPDIKLLTFLLLLFGVLYFVTAAALGWLIRQLYF